jgi:hypothetical protein
MIAEHNQRLLHQPLQQQPELLLLQHQPLSYPAAPHLSPELKEHLQPALPLLQALRVTLPMKMKHLIEYKKLQSQRLAADQEDALKIL